MAGTQSVSERLRDALERREKNMSWLHEQVKDSGVRGSSYGSVYAYVTGEAKTEPPLEFLREAADALKVPLAYLVTGDEPVTEEEAEVGGIAGKTVDELDSSDELEAFIAAAEGDREWKASVWLKYRTLNALGIPGPDLSPADPDGFREEMRDWKRGVNIRHIPHWVPLVAEARRRLNVDPVAIGEALRGPLDALDVDANAMTREELADYISAMIPVLLTLDPHHEEED